jgi:hypothetical protein
MAWSPMIRVPRAAGSIMSFLTFVRVRVGAPSLSGRDRDVQHLVALD